MLRGLLNRSGYLKFHICKEVIVERQVERTVCFDSSVDAPEWDCAKALSENVPNESNTTAYFGPIAKLGCGGWL